MNLLIANLNSALLNRIDANVIKTLQGEFTKEELSDQLVNLYYSKVIIDITAIKNYTDFNCLFDFLSYFEKDRIIILLDENTSKECISKLVQEGYYDFTRNVGGINYLIDHPNTLKDVEKYLIPNSFHNPLFNSTNKINPTNNVEANNEIINDKSQIIIGIQDLTPHAGATTLMYMMVKALRNYYNVQGIEMMSQDYIYFRDNSISEATSIEDLKMKIRLFKDKEAIIVDLNDVDASEICDYILYLIEPGIVSLTKLMSSNNIFNNISKNGRIVLNRSSIKEDDLPSFEYETKLSVFYNLENLNERNDKLEPINGLLIKLGFNKLTNSGGLFSHFK